MGILHNFDVSQCEAAEYLQHDLKREKGQLSSLDKHLPFILF